ncbi:hypothetical protein I3900191A7_22930 [Clostridium baratii]|uniref:formylglycine-generating enzyme family protein n=1 Tax=Clostridium baratii TaxID=1561 RepID=UPI0036F440DD
MLLYDNLRNFLDSCYDGKENISMVDIFYNYEYFTNIMSAYIASENKFSNEFVNKLYKEPKPTFGNIFSRFKNLYEKDDSIKIIIEKSISKRFFLSVKKLYSELLEFNIESEINISNLNYNDFNIVIITLLKIIVYLRNAYLHERMIILDVLLPTLENIYLDLIMSTNKLDIGEDTDFIQRHDGEIIFLNTINPKAIYKNSNYRSIYDLNYELMIEHIEIDIENNDNEAREICIDGIEFIKVPSGTIRFKGYDSDEIIDYYIDGFCISKYPISNGQFIKFLNNNKEYAISRYKNPDFMKDYRKYGFNKQKQYYNNAVYYIDWNDATKYCNYLSNKNGYKEVYKDNISNLGINGFRLPTELEWYYAATCGKGSNAKLPNINDIIYRYNRGIDGKVDSNDKLYKNEWNIHGMLGNINEWTNSSTDKLKIKKFEKNSKINERRIIKGGSFASHKRLINFDYSTDVNIDNMHYIGIRIVISQQ